MSGCGTNHVPRARPITRGPAYHWFGYYDKLAFDPKERYVLGAEVDFEGRHPGTTDAIRVGMVDIADGDRWIELGHSTAWNWQQGCMLQWLPGDLSRVAWNDHDDGALVTRLLDLDGAQQPTTLSRPICCIAPDGSFALSIDFTRVATFRPGYGYQVFRSPRTSRPVPDDDGIWRIDLGTGQSRLLLSIAAADAVGPPRERWDQSLRHWLYHALVSPSGARMAFLHCAARGDGRYAARLMTATVDGRDIREINPGGRVSHFCWRDADTLLAWARGPGFGAGFHLFGDREPTRERVGDGAMLEDGHCTYLDDRRWILCDTYPGILGYQTPYLFDTETQLKHRLGSFFAPAAYRGPHRCDLHPRGSPTGRLVALDSAHAGGRQMYLLDVSPLLDASAEPDASAAERS